MEKFRVRTWAENCILAVFQKEIEEIFDLSLSALTPVATKKLQIHKNSENHPHKDILVT